MVPGKSKSKVKTTNGSSVKTEHTTITPRINWDISRVSYSTMNTLTSSTTASSRIVNTANNSATSTPAPRISKPKTFDRFDCLWMPGFAPNDVQFYDYAPHTMYYPVELYCGKPVQIPEEKEPKAKRDALIKSICVAIWRRNIEHTSTVAIDDCFDSSVKVFRDNHTISRNSSGAKANESRAWQIWCSTQAYLNGETLEYEHWQAILNPDGRSLPPPEAPSALSCLGWALGALLTFGMLPYAMYKQKQHQRYGYTIEYEELALSMIRVLLKFDLKKLGPSRARSVAATIYAAGHGMIGYDIISDPDSCNRMDLFKCIWIWTVAIRVAASSPAGKYLEADFSNTSFARKEDRNPFKKEGTFAFELDRWNSMREIYLFMLGRRPTPSSIKRSARRQEYAAHVASGATKHFKDGDEKK